MAVDQVKVRRVDDDKHIDWIAVNGGIIEVADNVITIVADSAERARDIDISRAERAKLRAEKRLKKPKISIRLIWNVVLKLLFNAPLTGLMSEIVYKIFKIRWRFCPHLIFVGRESKEESTDQIMVIIAV